ncbi:MAG: hypothetical protein IJ530_04350 [Treponema sp.]|uniref:hypothetical protein n=1 Tax=Treponema sp. TaxID=166 RepID=UPI0025FFA246|nr:hypothetical protein [Treponema sp.]MBQ8678976.1 hypothetical protein [Treponema sp.]
MLLQNENDLEDKIFNEIIDPIVDPIYDIICKSSIRGIMSNVKQLVDISPVKFKFGFKFYNYYDVIFEYEDEKLIWKAFSCKKNDEMITNNIIYNPKESQKIVRDIDEIVKAKIPTRYLKEIFEEKYESFEKRLDYITVSSKQEFNELKRKENNDDFKTTDECLNFMIDEVKNTFGSDAENFKIIDNYDYHGWHINFTFEAYKSFTVKIIHELEDGAQIVIGSDEQIRNGDMEHWFNVPMSANDFGRKTAKEFLAQLKENLELRLF